MPQEKINYTDTITVRHVAGPGPPAFRVEGLESRQIETPVLSPAHYKVKGRPGTNLLGELNWYLESFLDYPLPPETEHAASVLEALKEWGSHTFEALFGQLDFHSIQLRILSDDPAILAWPWEALHSRKRGPAVAWCSIERRLQRILEIDEPSSPIQASHLNVLLVIPRPYKEDIRFSSLGLHLLQLIEHQALPARLHVLRPPTLDKLSSYLQEKPAYYQILHFDGHGLFSANAGARTEVGRGTLFFETDNGTPHAVTTDEIRRALKAHIPPIVLLNACQSAVAGDRSGESFLSVAVGLLDMGVQSVLAMAHSLRADGAVHFFRTFYKSLFENGDIREAVRSGRQQMFEHQDRYCERGRYPLSDWIVPVLYQRSSVSIILDRSASSGVPTSAPHPGGAAAPAQQIARDRHLLKLERAIRDARPGILLFGLAGVGKTVLAYQFLYWFQATTTQAIKCLWYSCKDADWSTLFGRLAADLLQESTSSPLSDKTFDLLVEHLRKSPCLVVFDGVDYLRDFDTNQFDSRGGNTLAALLRASAGGVARFILTSRTASAIDQSLVSCISIDGFESIDECWGFCQQVLEQSSAKPTPKAVGQLIRLLRGHPLALRALLPLLPDSKSHPDLDKLTQKLERYHRASDELYQPFSEIDNIVSKRCWPLLIGISLCDDYTTPVFFVLISAQSNGEIPDTAIDETFESLSRLGLTHRIDKPIQEASLFAMHPLLGPYLRRKCTSQLRSHVIKKTQGAFVDAIALSASRSKKPDTFPGRAIALFGGTIKRTMDLADRLRKDSAFLLIATWLASLSGQLDDYPAAEEIYHRLADWSRKRKLSREEAMSYHDLGAFAIRRHEYATAETLLRRSLKILHDVEDVAFIVRVYFSLGVVYERQHDLESAELYLREALRRAVGTDDNEVIAGTSMHMGLIRQGQQRITEAEEWYLASLPYMLSLDNKVNLASIYVNLGTLAHEKKSWSDAQQWYLKNLALQKSVGSELETARAYYTIGRLEKDQSHFSEAQHWLHSALSILEPAKDIDAARCHLELGDIAMELGDFPAAETWFSRSLDIYESAGDNLGRGQASLRLGDLMYNKKDYQLGAEWYLRSIQSFRQANDHRRARMAENNFGVAYSRATAQQQSVLQEKWYEAGFRGQPRLWDPRPETQ